MYKIEFMTEVLNKEHNKIIIGWKHFKTVRGLEEAYRMVDVLKRQSLQAQVIRLEKIK